MIPDGWQTKRLSDIAIFMMGHAFSSNDFCEDGVPLIRMGNLYQNRLSLDRNTVFLPVSFIERYKKLKINHGDILISMTGTMGKQDYGYAVLIPDDSPLMLLNQRVTKINFKEYNSQEYLLYLLRSELVLKQIYSNPGGTKQANLSIKQLGAITVQVPPLLEQCRIAEVLRVWDESIDLLERLIGKTRSRKQGLMQQLLTGKRRFKEFEGSEWKRYHFKDIFTRITRKNTINNSNILTISGTHGLINQRDFFNKRVAADNLDGYYLIEKGEFAYNKSYSNGYPLGAIKRLDRYDAGVLSTLYICFGLSNPLNSGDFTAHYFESGIFNKEIYGIAQEGARNHGLLNISVTDFFELFLRIPSLPEQEKIAAVLSAADEEISTLEKQLAAYKQQKLGLMQQLLTGRIRI